MGGVSRGTGDSRKWGEMATMWSRVVGCVAMVCVVWSCSSADGSPPLAASPESWLQVSSVAGSPRMQWNANSGYCGETSLLTAGIQFGQYASQWTARSLASPGIPQTDVNAQLLLGVNGVSTATEMRLDAQRGPETQNWMEFMSWVREEVVAGRVVILGVFNNTFMLGESGMGDDSYDHIVPVYGFESSSPLVVGSSALGDDVLTLSDNGLRTIQTHMPFYYSYRVEDFRRSREGADAVGGPVYSMPEVGPWYGLSVAGPTDPSGVLLPVRLVVSPNGEGLQNEAVMAAPPAPQPVTVTVKVDRRDVDVVVYEYEQFADVPTSSFNALASQALERWDVAAGEGVWSVQRTFSSDETRVYRAVLVSAP